MSASTRLEARGLGGLSSWQLRKFREIDTCFAIMRHTTVEYANRFFEESQAVVDDHGPAMAIM